MFDAEQVVVGTTVATNAVIQRRGARVIFLTNEGFTDVPFIGRIDKERLYDLHWEKPPPLVSRSDCFGLRGRLDRHGQQVEPLDRKQLSSVVEALSTIDGDFAVAVSCLFSYLRPDDEQGDRGGAPRRASERPRLRLPRGLAGVARA